MAWSYTYRRPSYTRFRRYFGRYGSRYTSYNKLKTSRNVKASAQNMTQGGKFTVTSHDVKSIQIDQGNAYNGFNLDLADLIWKSAMHKNLSNVFDQYRIEKVIVKIRDGGAGGLNGFSTTMLPVLASIVDRTGTAVSLNLDAMRTYSSYKETQLSGNNDVSPVHYAYIGASTVVEASQYFDTKNAASFPKLYCAVVLPANVPNSTGADPYAYLRNLTIDVEAQIRYRGVRLDTTVIV